MEDSSKLNSIDLSSADITTSLSLLKQLDACMDSGFFYVTNHGISEEFMDQVFTQSKNFFDLPLEEKMKLLRNEKHRGYTPALDELLDPANQIHGDHKEGFYIGIELPEDDPQAQRPFYGTNLWPDSVKIICCNKTDSRDAVLLASLGVCTYNVYMCGCSRGKSESALILTLFY
ncbi:putative flavanone 3-dioxygenase [Helianthus annuus]|nr:putative flavanone 3-dioxygenase [Helianthus annuus]KAJ0573912.1 putative flavanone 3-dioxygenase [Helianthus annuus]KAJ0738246.1 putative flavanone 3-dioxygenase [Helianthus annuus]